MQVHSFAYLFICLFTVAMDQNQGFTQARCLSQVFMAVKDIMTSATLIKKT